MNAALCIPIMAEDQVLGLLALKDERLREAYATDEIDLFRGVAAQMAITVQNSKLYERMKERDRLAALGEMAAGLAHEIRNPLGAIKGAAQLLMPPASTAPARATACRPRRASSSASSSRRPIGSTASSRSSSTTRGPIAASRSRSTSTRWCARRRSW